MTTQSNILECQYTPTLWMNISYCGWPALDVSPVTTLLLAEEKTTQTPNNLTFIINQKFCRLPQFNYLLITLRSDQHSRKEGKPYGDFKYQNSDIVWYCNHRGSRTKQRKIVLNFVWFSLWDMLASKRTDYERLRIWWMYVGVIGLLMRFQAQIRFYLITELEEWCNDNRQGHLCST